METKTVYRVVHSVTDMGPWCSQNYCGLLSGKAAKDIATAMEAVRSMAENRNNFLSSHPSVVDDIPMWLHGMLCAVESLHQIVDWFDGTVLEILKQCNFVIKAITLPASQVKIGRSGKQVAIAKKATVIAEQIIPFDALTTGN